MSGAVIIQQPNGQVLDLSAMIQSAAQATATEMLALQKVQSKRGRSDKGTGSPDLGKILLDAREYLDYTQAELGREAGVHPTTISKIEDGERGMSMLTLAKLSPWLPDDFTRDVLKYYAKGDDVGRTHGDAARGQSSRPVTQPSVQDDDGAAEATAAGTEASF